MKAYYTELPLVSPSLGLGCTPDFIGSVISGGETRDMILDWKTGKSLYPSYQVQLAMYMAILYDYTGVLIEDLGVVQIPQDGGKPKVKIVEDPWDELYAGLLTFERWKHDHSRPGNDPLLWARAPQQMIDVRMKLRGKKRKAFDEAEWQAWFAWPWLNCDSLAWWKTTYEKLKGEKHELESTTGREETKRWRSLHSVG